MMRRVNPMWKRHQFKSVFTEVLLVNALRGCENVCNSLDFDTVKNATRKTFGKYSTLTLMISKRYYYFRSLYITIKYFLSQLSCICAMHRPRYILQQGLLFQGFLRWGRFCWISRGHHSLHRDASLQCHGRRR